MAYSHPCPCLSRSRLALGPCDPKLHCTHTQAGDCGVADTPMRKSFSPVSQFIGDGLSKRLPHFGGMFANSFLLPCRHSCKPGYADCLRGVLCGLCQVTTVGPIICQYRVAGLQPIFHISCFRVLYPGPHRLYSIIMQNKKDSTDNCDSCPASHTDSRHGHFPSLNVSVVDSTTDIVRATQPAWKYTQRSTARADGIESGLN